MDSHANVPTEDTGSSEVFDGLGDIVDVDNKHIVNYEDAMPITVVPVVNSGTVLPGDLYFGDALIGGDYLLGALPMNTPRASGATRHRSVDPRHPFYDQINSYRNKRDSRKWTHEPTYPERSAAATMKPRGKNGQFTADEDVQ